MSADRDPIDPALAALLREHSAETPPAGVDAAILAAAHRAVGSAPRARHRALASQAVAVVDAARGRSGDRRCRDRRAAAGADASSTTPRRSSRDAPSRGEAATRVLENRGPRAAEAGRVAEAPQRSAPPSTTAPAAHECSGSDRCSAREAGVRERRPAIGCRPTTRGREPASAADAAVREQSAAEGLRKFSGTMPEKPAPDAWIARIARIARRREAGGSVAGARAIPREAYPDADARLPADLREWAVQFR